MAIWIAGFWATIALWLIGKAWLEALWRNPEWTKAYFVPAILALALSEAVAIYWFVIAFMILSK